MDGDKKLKHFIKQPTYKGGNEAFKNDIYSQLKYPKAAFELKVEGVIFLEYDIDYKGNVIDARVLQGIGHGCDEEACRVLKLLKFDVPATRGVRILFHKKAKIQFKLPQTPALEIPNQVQQVQVNYQYTITPTQPTVEKPNESPAITYQIKLNT
jgi:TonB family protein